MSKIAIQLRFDGPELETHEMDVTLLGPALVGLGELCSAANQTLNGNQASTRVLVQAHVKPNCVTFDLSIVQHVWDQAVNLVACNQVAGAKEILEWIGIINTTLGFRGLLQYLRWKKDRKETCAERKQTDSGKIVVVHVVGDNNVVKLSQDDHIQISEEVYRHHAYGGHMRE